MLKMITLLMIVSVFLLTEAEKDQTVRVAFSAGITKDQNVGKIQTVVFDKVFVNIGDSFDKAKGVFTAPVAGTFAFHIHAMTETGKKLYLELYHNHRYVESIFSHSEGAFYNAGNSVLLSLTKGDIVYLRDSTENRSVLYGKPYMIVCTFTGYLISQHKDESIVLG